jgi:outer membrane protein assembly factor BamE (lipoprotein component of BamABCDE complex)
MMWIVLRVTTLLLILGITMPVAVWIRRGWRVGLRTLVIAVLVLIFWACLVNVSLTASWIFPSDTMYASKYTDQKWKAVNSGASRRLVTENLGYPLLENTTGDETYLYYSKHGPRYKNYWIKILVLDARTGSVKRKIDEFYSD